MATYVRRDQVLSALADKIFAGSAKVEASSLYFVRGAFELDSSTIGHHIPLMIDSAEFNSILRTSSITAEDLATASASGDYKKLSPGTKKLCCFIAATSFLPLPSGEEWRIVDIYVANLSKLTKQFDHQCRFSDGEAYQDVRKRGSSNAILRKWKARLSTSKWTGLTKLLGHELFTAAFDSLLDFVGLWTALQLGNIQRILAMRCDEEILRFLKHIFSCWDQITLKDKEIRKLVTPEVVEFFQLRAPAASSIDREEISRAFENGTVFSSLSPEKRDEIKTAVLRLELIIPSIKTFHQNTKLLGLGASILKSSVIDKSLRTTVYKEVMSHCNPVRFATSTDLTETEYKDLVYKEIWLFSFSHFPELSGIPPRKEVGQETPTCHVKCPLVEQELASLAATRCIKTRKLDRVLTTNPKLSVLERTVSELYSAYTLDHRNQIVKEILRILPERKGEQCGASKNVCFTSPHGETLNRRCGRPLQNSFESCKDFLYLANLVDVTVGPPEALPTALYVLRDIIGAFFGRTDPAKLSGCMDFELVQQPGEIENIGSGACDDSLQRDVNLCEDIPMNDDNSIDEVGTRQPATIGATDLYTSSCGMEAEPSISTRQPNISVPEMPIFSLPPVPENEQLLPAEYSHVTTTFQEDFGGFNSAPQVQHAMKDACTPSRTLASRSSVMNSSVLSASSAPVWEHLPAPTWLDKRSNDASISFVLFNGSKVWSKVVDNQQLKSYLLCRIKWILLGGTDFGMAKAIKQHHREKMIETHPKWKYVFVRRENTNMWKQNYVDLLKILDTDNQSPILRLLRASPAGDAPRGTTSLSRKSTLSGRPPPTLQRTYNKESHAREEGVLNSAPTVAGGLTSKAALPESRSQIESLLKRPLHLITPDNPALRIPASPEELSRRYWNKGGHSNFDEMRKRGKRQHSSNEFPNPQTP